MVAKKTVVHSKVHKIAHKAHKSDHKAMKKVHHVIKTHHKQTIHQAIKPVHKHEIHARSPPEKHDKPVKVSHPVADFSSLHKTHAEPIHAPPAKKASLADDNAVKHIRAAEKQPESFQKVLIEYMVVADNVPAKVVIYSFPKEYVPIYELKRTLIQPATQAIVDKIKDEIISTVNITTKEFVDPQAIILVKQRFMQKANELVLKYLPELSESDRELICGDMIHKMLGLGDIELLLNDNYLEEIVINNSSEPVWVYHKRFGWVKTDICFENEETIYNYTSAIGRKVGRQITNLHPLMDAYLSTGDRVNATIFPISSRGNTLTIRRFSRDPWTIVNLIDPKVNTLSKEIASVLWLAMQYEFNMLVVGGTASGKTSILNAIVPFIPPNQRIISIEDTREIQLPSYMHWVPLSAREANPEGKGRVSMLDLLVNSLRMRPDRIIVGEIRRRKEAEVMFEAIRTGHSAYATFHADRAEQAYNRLSNPPINLPEPLLNALHLMIVQYRHRRMGIRRTLEVAEVIPGDIHNNINLIYKWDPKTDVFERSGRFIRIINEMNLYTGMDESQIEKNLVEKQKVLEWMLNYNVKKIDAVGKIVAEYYRDEAGVVKSAKANDSPKDILGSKIMGELDKQ